MNKNSEKYLKELIERAIKEEIVYIVDEKYKKDEKILNELLKEGFISIYPISSQQVIPRGVSPNERDKILEERKKNSILYYKIIINKDIISKISRERLNNKNIKGGHDQIIFSLINFLKKKNNFLFFSNFEIKTKFGISRPDLYVIPNKENVSDIVPICYEIKHSHNDFMSDVKQPNKRSSYLEISPQLYYVCPVDVIKPHEIPAEAGLIYMDKNENFDVIVNAPIHNQWVNNFNISLLNTLIRHKSNENIDFFISENATIKNKVRNGDFNSLCSNKNLILMSKNNLHVLDRFAYSQSDKTFRDFSLLYESYGAVYDLLGLNIINIEHVKREYFSLNNYSNVFRLTEVGKKLITEIKDNNKNINYFRINDRITHKKFSFHEIKYKGEKIFDFYMMNKEKKMDKLLLTGFIKVKNEKELSLILNNKSRLEFLKRFCQKLAFVNFENNIDKKLIPAEYSLFQADKYNSTSHVYPRKEVKRGKKEDIENVDINIFLCLLKDEYFNRQCFIF